MTKVTIQSMAKELGLSRNTVSMALKGNELVTPRTRDMVLRYAEQVGYLPARDGSRQGQGSYPLENPENRQEQERAAGVPDSRGDSKGQETYIPDSRGDSKGQEAYIPGNWGDSKGQEAYIPGSHEGGQANAANTPGSQPGKAIQWTDTPEHHILILRKTDVAVYWDKVVNGISEEASRNHCQTKVAVITREDEEEQRLPLGLDGEIEAVFCLKMTSPDYVRKVKQTGARIFMLDACIDAQEELLGDVVKPEGFQPVKKLTQHLLDQGMRKIGYLNDTSNQFETMRDRYNGFRHAMDEVGAEFDPELVQPDISHLYLPENFEKIVEGYCRHGLPEAVVCGNDETAKLLTRALRKKGFRVPEDVAVTGFDNDEEGMLDPFFTTVSVDAKWLGRRLLQCFLWRMEHPGAPYEKISVSGRVILRKSSVRKAE